METSFRASGPVGGKHGGRGHIQRTTVRTTRIAGLPMCWTSARGGRTSSGRHAQTYDTRGASLRRHLGHHASKARQTWARRARFITDPFGCARALRWRTLTPSPSTRCARAVGAPCALATAILVMGTPPSALQGHGDGQQQMVMQLPLMRRERLRLQAQQHGAGCRRVAFRHVEQTGGSSVREWMLRLDRMGQARFYGQTTRCAPPLADRYAPAQTVP